RELRDGRVVETAAVDRAQQIVGCGRPADDTELAIVDPESFTRVTGNAVGEIWLRSPSVADGYYGRTEATERVFGGRLVGDPHPWLRTGDLGALLDGELVITGRRKDLIVIHGQNYYPQDLERAVEAAHPDVRAGRVVAFAVDGQEGERAVVAAEVRKEDEQTLASVVTSVRAAVARTHELSIELVLVRAGTISKTSSGKLQRSAMRTRFLDGELPSLTIARGPVHDATAAVYHPLDSSFEKLDRRRTSYQYDIETDIPWERVDDPRDCFGPTYLRRLGVDIELLRTEPQAWELFQWGMANAMCLSFVALEEAVIAFLRDESARLGTRRSVQLFDEEEVKHIATFDRYAALVAPRHPEHQRDLEAYLASFRAALRQVTNPARAARAAEHHYTMWLLFCWFEEFTILLHDLFAVEGNAVHPTWLAMHRAHKQEEQQHVVTDHAFLEAIDATEEERYAWSRAAFDLAGRVAIGMNERDFAIELVRRRFPELAARLVPGGLGIPLFVTLMREGLFPRTCAAGPYFAAIAREPDGRREVRVTEGALVDWLRTWVSNRVGHPVGADTPFRAAGLDSLGAMELSGELERRLGRRVSPTIVYEQPTISLLVGALGEVAVASPTLLDTDGPHARAERLLALDAHHPGGIPDAISAVYVSPTTDTRDLERALEAVVSRHSALSHGWRMEGRRFRRIAVSLPTIDTVPTSSAEFSATLARVAAEQERAPFELGAKAPWRATRVIAPDASALVFTIHHVATDGWSMAIVHRELSALMRGETLPPAPIVDQAGEEAHFLNSPDAATRLAWWRKRLAGHCRFNEPARAVAIAGSSMSRRLSENQFEGVLRAARRLGASPFEVMLAAWHRVQGRHEGSDDVLVQTHLLNRRSDAERKVVGYRVNPIVLRTDLSGTATFDEALERVRRAWMDALDHELPIDYLVRELWPERWLDRWMPARWAFNHIPRAEDPSGANGIEHREDVLPPPQFLFFDGMLVMRPRADGLDMTVWYDRNAVRERDAEELIEAFASELVTLAPRHQPTAFGARSTP
ncbi:MAG TPA: condensation domain-containing protein, partial [Labilithrix sp.]|nr:condensation domain-containing protein [Labilithrix sp.]